MYVSRRVKTCFVEGCLSNSEGFADKVFVTIPQNENRRRAWFEAARQSYVPSKTTRFCCEDHFNVPEDFENYMRFKLVGGQLLVKKHVVPHKFKWQSTPTLESVEEPVVKKRKMSTDSLPSTLGSTSRQSTVGIQLETDMQTSIKGEHSGVAKKIKAEVVPHLFECHDDAADDGAVASTSTDFMTYNNLSSLEEDVSNEDDPDLLPDRPLIPVDESIVKIEIEEEPLKIKNEPFIIENDPLTSDTHEKSTVPFIKEAPSEKPDLQTSETVEQLDESERQSIQMFFDSMARTAMTLSPSFVSRIKSEVLRVVIDIEMEAYKKKMEDLKEPSRKTDKVDAASNETEPKIKIEIEDVEEAEASNELDEPELLDPDHDANYEPLAKKKKKSKTEQPTSSSSALQVDRTPITLHEPVETFFQSIAYTVTSFPPPFICKAKVAVLNVISKMEVEACRSRQSGYQDGGGGDDSATRHLLASGSN